MATKSQEKLLHLPLIINNKDPSKGFDGELKESEPTMPDRLPKNKGSPKQRKTTLGVTDSGPVDLTSAAFIEPSGSVIVPFDICTFQEPFKKALKQRQPQKMKMAQRNARNHFVRSELSQNKTKSIIQASTSNILPIKAEEEPKNKKPKKVTGIIMTPKVQNAKKKFKMLPKARQAESEAPSPAQGLVEVARFNYGNKFNKEN